MQVAQTPSLVCPDSSGRYCAQKHRDESQTQQAKCLRHGCNHRTFHWEMF
jgi:hypothetical protein